MQREERRPERLPLDDAVGSRLVYRAQRGRSVGSLWSAAGSSEKPVEPVAIARDQVRDFYHRGFRVNTLRFASYLHSLLELDAHGGVRVQAPRVCLVSRPPRQRASPVQQTLCHFISTHRSDKGGCAAQRLPAADPCLTFWKSNVCKFTR